MSVVGEAGSWTGPSPGADVPIRIDFNSTITNPVIGITSTNIGGDFFSIRITATTDTYFEFLIEEWEYLDGAHGAVETINWIAVAEGTHRLDDGRVIEAGFTSATETTGSAGFSTEFQSEITSPPVVVTSVMSNNDTITVDSDPLNITSSGFDVRLQQEEAQRTLNTHAAETVGWIAFETGGTSGASGLALTSGGQTHTNLTHSFGDTFAASPIIVGDTQTVTGPDTARLELISKTTTDVTFSVQEERSQDSELNHIAETIGFVAIEAGEFTGQTICFTPGVRIATPLGERPVEDLNAGDLIITVDNGVQPIRWVGARFMSGARLHALPQERPVKIEAGALWPGCPAHDTIVSQQHRILLKGGIVNLLYGVSEVLVPTRALIGLPGITRIEALRETRYIHLLTPTHNVIFANGMQTETFHPAMDTLRGLREEDRAKLLEAVPDLTVNAYGATARRCLRVNEVHGLNVA